MKGLLILLVVNIALAQDASKKTDDSKKSIGFGSTNKDEVKTENKAQGAAQVTTSGGQNTRLFGGAIGNPGYVNPGIGNTGFVNPGIGHTGLVNPGVVGLGAQGSFGGAVGLGTIGAHGTLGGTVGLNGRPIIPGQLGHANPLLNPNIHNPLVNPNIHNPLLNPNIHNPLVNPNIHNPLINPNIHNPLVNPNIHNPLITHQGAIRPVGSAVGVTGGLHGNTAGVLVSSQTDNTIVTSFIQQHCKNLEHNFNNPFNPKCRFSCPSKYEKCRIYKCCDDNEYYKCPPVRADANNICNPRTRLQQARTLTPCEHDYDCNFYKHPTNKCCFDQCLKFKVCKPGYDPLAHLG